MCEMGREKMVGHGCWRADDKWIWGIEIRSMGSRFVSRYCARYPPRDMDYGGSH